MAIVTWREITTSNIYTPDKNVCPEDQGAPESLGAQLGQVAPEGQ